MQVIPINFSLTGVKNKLKSCHAVMRTIRSHYFVISDNKIQNTLIRAILYGKKWIPNDVPRQCKTGLHRQCMSFKLKFENENILQKNV
jgi:hypothetical protein